MNVRLYHHTASGSGSQPRHDGPLRIAVKAWKEAVFKTIFVHSNIAAERMPVADYLAIEAQARAARSAWIGSKFRAGCQVLARKFSRIGQA